MNSTLFRRTRSRLLSAIAIACAVSVTATSASLADPSEPSQVTTQELLSDALVAVGETEGNLVEPTLNSEVLEFGTDEGAVFVQATEEGKSLVVGAENAEQEFSFGLPIKSAPNDAQMLEDGTAVFSDDEIDLALQTHDDGAIRAQTIIHDADAPHEFRYELGLPEGSFAEIAEDGGVDVFQSFPDENETVLTSRFEPAWAVDASGETVKTWYELHDGDLVQKVDIGEDHDYPVVADPFWIPAIIVAIRVTSIVIKVGSKTVKYAKAPASRVVNALSSFKTLSYRTGSHTFKLDKSGMKHILQRHHPKYWDGSSKSSQTFFNPKMSVNDVRNLVHGAMKQNQSKLKSGGTNKRIQLEGTYNNVKYKMVIDRGRVVQFYPR
ncbi:hypothetical protein [Glutamicibacter creatinolyticus]|uniref:hypothetical protein n=2 Tax=Micrococcaceae TaxID=1268 RepID=UPI0031CF7A91